MYFGSQFGCRGHIIVHLWSTSPVVRTSIMPGRRYERRLDWSKRGNNARFARWTHGSTMTPEPSYRGEFCYERAYEEA
jgi:hypothetical protein